MLFYKFIEAWLLGLIAFVVGRYVGRGYVKLSPDRGRLFFIYLKIWTVTFIGQLIFGFLGHALQWGDDAQLGYAEFLLPLAVGTYFARQLFLLEMQRGNQ